MDDFSTPNAVNYFGLKPSELNFIKGGKRPMSSSSLINSSFNKLKAKIFNSNRYVANNSSRQQ